MAGAASAVPATLPVPTVPSWLRVGRGQELALGAAGVPALASVGGDWGDPGWKHAAVLGSAPAVGAAGTLVVGASPR